jgi:hypothetical protein
LDSDCLKTKQKAARLGDFKNPTQAAGDCASQENVATTLLAAVGTVVMPECLRHRVQSQPTRKTAAFLGAASTL